MSSEKIDTVAFERLQALFVDTFGVSAQEIGPRLEFGDLPQWDSMGHMDLMLGLESEFGVAINAETISELTTVQAILAHIEGQVDG